MLLTFDGLHGVGSGHGLLPRAVDGPEVRHVCAFVSDDIFGENLIVDLHECTLRRLADGECGGLRGAEETKGGEEVREALNTHVESGSLVADENVCAGLFYSIRMQRELESCEGPVVPVGRTRNPILEALDRLELTTVEAARMGDGGQGCSCPYGCWGSSARADFEQTLHDGVERALP